MDADAARQDTAAGDIEIFESIQCPIVALVSDNLNTHTPGAFLEVFEPERARNLVQRIEFCQTFQ